MAQQFNPSARPHQRQHPPRRLAQGVRVSIRSLARAVRPYLLAVALAVGLASPLNAQPQAPAGALLQAVPLDRAGHGPVRAGASDLGQSPRPDWITSLVELFSAVPPECSAVSKQNTQQKCQQRERGVLENFKEQHPVAFNLLVAGLTLLAGFWIGGGFERAR